MAAVASKGRGRSAGGAKAAGQRVNALATSAHSIAELVEGFNSIWRSGPFSHVRLQVATAGAEDKAAYLDGLRVGGDGARLEDFLEDFPSVQREKAVAVLEAAKERLFADAFAA